MNFGILTPLANILRPYWRRMKTMIALHRPIVARDDSAARLARFRAMALAGDPAAWELLEPAELDREVARARVHGLVTIGEWIQHQPKALESERFPESRISPEKRPGFTVVTPSFNQAEFIEATIRSVLDQKNVRVDYVVQDGGSTDSSVEIITRAASAARRSDALTRVLRWESVRDEGYADAVEKGFASTKGAPDDLMAYLNSDDQFMPGALTFVADYFAEHPDVDVVFGHRVIVDSDGLEIGRWFTPRLAMAEIRFYDLVPQETLFWRRRIWDKVGGIDSSYKFAADWDLILRFASAGARFARLPWFLGLFRSHARQKTQTEIGGIGEDEMTRLRQREFECVPNRTELGRHMQRALLDSAIVKELFLSGRRV